MASDELEKNSISCKGFLILSFAKDFCCWGSPFSRGDRQKPLLIGVSEVGAVFFLGHPKNVCCHFVFAATTAYIYGHSDWSISVMSWQLRAILREAATRCNCRVQCCSSRTRFYSCSIACNIARNNFRGGHATSELLNTGGKIYCSHDSSNMTKVWLLCCKGQHVASWCSQDNGDSCSPRQRRTSGKMVLVAVSFLWAVKK